ncbi:MAG TPA: hypothetical protein VG758_30470, partial [Hyphomicrobiaceae bacterium]|nr:hypothetical protein [Hyphomicrobiaceae bacterium]
KVPQLFVSSGASKWGDPKGHPWTIGYHPDYRTEAIVYAKHILAHVQDAKIAVLMQNDDYGRDYLDGLRAGPCSGIFHAATRPTSSTPTATPSRR